MLSDCPSRPPAESALRRGGLLPRRAARTPSGSRSGCSASGSRAGSMPRSPGRPARRRWKWAPGGASSTSSSAGRPSGCSRRCCGRRGKGGPVLIEDGFCFPHPSLQGKHVGRRVFHRQLCCARALGVVGVETFADRRAEDRGYAHWPRFGFDGPLPAAFRQRLPQQLATERSVLDLIESQGRAARWRRYGVALTVCFDLADESRSWRVFRRHLDAASRSPASIALRSFRSVPQCGPS